jgi:hypothetical protein
VSKLDEIEAAADGLALEEKQELMVFLATRMRAQRVQKLEPKKFSRDQMAGWVAEDEADMRRFQHGK